MNLINYPPPFERWMITFTIMLVAILEVLDMTIVNVALPPMMGALGTTSDKITWVLTSYIVTSAIVMLLTGFLDGRFGRRRLLLISILGFIISSALCGASNNLTEIVFFRALQGIFGASLVPLSQTILRSIFPLEEQGKAMAIWGIGIMVAPILGPTLGGYITDFASWRWVFYINVPICAISFFMTLRYITNTEKRLIKIDWIGALLMAVGVGALQFFLDDGNTDSWFQSNYIILLALISVITLGIFIVRGLKKPDNILNLRLFKDRNFAFSTFFMAVFSIGVFGIVSIQPILLENYFGYPAEFAGLVMAPRGIAAAIGMVIAGGLMNKIDPRKFMFAALIAAITGNFMMSSYNLDTSPMYWIISGAVQGLGMGMFMVPLATISLSTIKQKDTAEASGLFSFSRNLGSSIGISILSTIITRQTQINWNRLGANINPYNQNLQLWLNQQGLQLHNPATLNQLQQTIAMQAGMIAYINTFWAIGISMFFLLPFVFFIKRPKFVSTESILH